MGASTTRAALAELFLTLFWDNRALEGWLSLYSEYGNQLADRLPSSMVSRSEYCSAAAELLIRWGLDTDPELYRSLFDEFPMQSEKILRVANAVGVSTESLAQALPPWRLVVTGGPASPGGEAPRLNAAQVREALERGWLSRDGLLAFVPKEADPKARARLSRSLAALTGSEAEGAAILAMLES